jgi:hypothetical protein
MKRKGFWYLISNVAGSTVSHATRLFVELTKSYSLKSFTHHITFNLLRFITTNFDQYDHHQASEIIVEETAVRL